MQFFFMLQQMVYILLPQGFKELMIKVVGPTVLTGSLRVKTVVNWKQPLMLFCILKWKDWQFRAAGLTLDAYG